ncbi:hypothetical protein KQX54_016708 [Cotesia glomerata]|uniref:Uncharacterized protein n=1 Tax=Cotesia glomerata TaxID=32391 RepID=A0AAV7ITY0_COTGL|nr:hypothetical protein KQX54_016708 [Cotesia glomerata]
MVRPTSDGPKRWKKIHVQTPEYARAAVTPRSTEIKTSIPEFYLHQSANFHQGDKKYFKHQRRGVQCTAIATVACILLPPITIGTITTEDLDKVLISEDLYYQECRN